MHDLTPLGCNKVSYMATVTTIRCNPLVTAARLVKRSAR
jgi:hypothetical protein